MKGRKKRLMIKQLWRQSGLKLNKTGRKERQNTMPIRKLKSCERKTKNESFSLKRLLSKEVKLLDFSSGFPTVVTRLNNSPLPPRCLWFMTGLARSWTLVSTAVSASPPPSPDVT